MTEDKEVLEESEERWTDAYQHFIDIVDKAETIDPEKIKTSVDELYKKHKGEPVWDEAYRRWNETDYDLDMSITEATRSQRKSIYANGYKGESLAIKDLSDNSKGFLKFINTGLSIVSKILDSDNLISGDGFDLIERDDVKSNRQVNTKSETFYYYVEGAV